MRTRLIGNMECLEDRYQLPADGNTTARLARIREALASEIAQTDPEAADDLRHRYDAADLVCFMNKVVKRKSLIVRKSTTSIAAAERWRDQAKCANATVDEFIRAIAAYEEVMSRRKSQRRAGAVEPPPPGARPDDRRQT